MRTEAPMGDSVRARSDDYFRNGDPMAGDSQTMQCMEVWGGNEIVDASVVMSGLDLWVYSKPFGQSAGGGDVYYVSSCATGRIERLLVADVSGHGATVGDVAGQLRQLMRQFVNYLDQRRFVRTMNDRFAQLSRNGCFATAIVATFFAPTRSLSLCNAGHPPPLLYRAGRRQWSFLERDLGSSDPAAPSGAAGNIPLGIMDLTDYEQFEHRLDVGDLVLLYTDSLIEARDGGGEMLGRRGLLELLSGVAVDDPAKLIPAVLDAVARQEVKNLDLDDVTVMLLRANGSTQHFSVMDKLRAAGRFGRALLGRPFGGEAVPFPDPRLANIGGAMIPWFNRLWQAKIHREGANVRRRAKKQN
ncbi:MAG TPA: PP2C family protein-serine/threonine phosphatase [Tepidisphaeraceae bacterium]